METNEAVDDKPIFNFLLKHFVTWTQFHDNAQLIAHLQYNILRKHVNFEKLKLLRMRGKSIVEKIDKLMKY